MHGADVIHLEVPFVGPIQKPRNRPEVSLARVFVADGSRKELKESLLRRGGSFLRVSRWRETEVHSKLQLHADGPVLAPSPRARPQRLCSRPLCLQQHQANRQDRCF